MPLPARRSTCCEDCEVRFFGGSFKGKAGAKRLYIDRFQANFTHGNNGPIDGFLLDHPQIRTSSTSCRTE